MNVREHFNDLYKVQKMAVGQIVKEFDKVEQYVSMPMPSGIKVAPLAAWCNENLGYDAFVICQNIVYFDDSVQAVKFKLMCNVDHIKSNPVKKRWY